VSNFQYDLVTSAMTAAMACLAGGLLYFVLVRSTVRSVYHPALAVGSVVVGVAALHYLVVISAFEDAWVPFEGAWIPSETPFANGIRYVDWLITVPLLLTQLVLVLRLEREEARGLIRKLVVASIAMIALGYPGEVSDDTTTKLVFWAAGIVPFAYLSYVLWVELNRSLFRYSDGVGLAVARARTLLVASWVAYPIAYLFPVLGFDGATGEVSRQLLYSVADVVSKVGFGLLVYRIARLLTEEEERGVSTKLDRQVDLADAGRDLSGVV